MCREHLSQLWRRKRELSNLGVRVSVVTFDVDALARNYTAHTEWDWPILIDQERKLYRAYSMGRGGWWAMYGPKSIWQYLKVMARGVMPGKPGADFRQFGGDILIDPAGAVRMRFVSRSPYDRPSVDAILSCVNEGSDVGSQ